ncbi:MAG: trypsin-like serine protease, partial [Desulfobacteraceae bacterium]
MKLFRSFSVLLCLVAIINYQAFADSDVEDVSGTPTKKIHYIIGGTQTPVDTYPWMTALLDKSSHELFCGGSLIAENWVLTAAHCVNIESPSEIQVYIGGVSLTDLSGGELRDVSRIYSHEDFKSEENDIAVLKLSEPSTKKPIGLASVELDDGLADGTSLWTAGWGVTGNEEDAQISNDLLHVEVPLRDHDICEANYQELDETSITDKMVCAGDTEGTRDSCNGDSGGPLMVKGSDGDLELLGIVSFGSDQGCATGTLPGVYTRVSRYLDWIAGKLDGSDLPEITASIKYIDFGLMGVGLESAREVTLTNDSTSPVVIQSTVLSGDPGFTIQSDNCQQKELEADQQCSVVISFSSEKAGAKNAELTINTTSSKNPTFVFEITAETLPKADFGEALDNTALAWFTDSYFPWEVVTDSGYVNESAVKSGKIQNGEATYLLSQVTGPGTLEFRWKSSTKEKDDLVVFYVDEELITYVGGETDWETVATDISEGTHYLTWIYERSEETSTGTNVCFLD